MDDAGVDQSPGERCCDAPVGHRDRDVTVCWNGHFTRASDGFVLPWATTYDGEVYDEQDRRLPLQLTMDFAPAVRKVGYGGVA